jgi:hypothetical protein
MIVTDDQEFDYKPRKGEIVNLPIIIPGEPQLTRTFLIKSLCPILRNLTVVRVK